MGYFERAIAIFQALIELNCRSPKEMKWLERLGLFEEFWDSERARFGDLVRGILKLFIDKNIGFKRMVPKIRRSRISSDTIIKL